ncbi:MAG: polysaccharide lyase 6 family protein [Gemmatimonadota bacterium]|nr:polysaccharide lyase 6 family protein [Gemmatimonadota bacterium]
MKSLSELEARMDEAQPGDVITLFDGVYDGERCRLAARGTADQPIVIRAENMGRAVIKAPLLVVGDYISFMGLHFVAKGSVEIRGRGCRITRCVMTDVQVGKWIRVRAESREVEIDRCRFENKTNNLEETRGCQLMQIYVRNQGERHRVHHNYFVDVPDGKESNGYETLQLITEGNPYDPEPGDCETVIEYNLFERCSGEAEIISVKSNGNILRRNTFRDCRGALVLRHGHGNVVSENFFFGEGERRAGGVRLQGTDQVVVNNLFHSLNAFGVGMMDGTTDDLYVRVERALIAFNTFVGCSPAMDVGLNHSRYPNGTAPKDCVVANNAFVRSDRTVRLVQDDEPVDWTWEGNVTDGDLGMPARDGIKTGQVDVDYLPNGVVAPAESSGLIGNAEGSYPDITTDVLGHSRGEQKTIGCVEFPTETEDGGPLTEADVGPGW